MSIRFKKYKRIFRRNLQPVFAVLLARRQAMDFVSWNKSVDQTLQHVINNPVEYLGNDPPEKQLMSDILEEIETEFLKEVATFDAVPKH